MGQERLVAVIAARPRAVAMERRLCSLAGFGGRDSFGWVDVVSGVISRAEWGVLLGWSAVLLGARKYSGVWLYLCKLFLGEIAVPVFNIIAAGMGKRKG